MGIENKYDDDDKKPKPAPRNPERRYAYFRDDQIVLFATHKKGVSVTKASKIIADKLTGYLKEIKKDAKVSPRSQVDSILRLSYETDGGPKSMLSMITFDVRKAPEDITYLTTLIEKFNNDSLDSTIEGLTIQGASPNWLTSVASQGGGTGGPGGRPSPYFGNRRKAPYRFHDLIEKLERHGLRGKGEGVDVAILDTAPCAHDLVSAYKEWPDHPLIPTLLGPNGKLHLYPATYAELLDMGNTSLNDFDFRMTDHGLFIAGIIHSIAPEAEIHLIEVLNHHGVGDFAAFVRGLKKVVTEKIYNPNRKLVLNCSWMLEFPRDARHCHHINNLTDPDAEFEREVLAFSQNDQATLHMLKSLFEDFYFAGRQAMAAAGNDRRTRALQIVTRYPAALDKVTGVGALPKTLEQGKNDIYLKSIYSNIADIPVVKGIATLGGEEGEGRGVLGLYIGEFPDCSCNESKWAWWAGTSFATPILTGAVAAALSSPPQISRTQDAIQRLYDANIIEDGNVDAGEDAMPVTQS